VSCTRKSCRARTSVTCRTNASAALANSFNWASFNSLSSVDKVGSADKSVVAAGVVIRRILPDLNGLLIIVIYNCRDLTKYCKPFTHSFSTKGVSYKWLEYLD